MQRRKRTLNGQEISTDDYTTLWERIKIRVISGGIFILFSIGFVFYLNSLKERLPSLTELEQYKPELVTKIYSADGKVIKELYTRKRVLVPLERIPKGVVDATIATEDRRFWNHWGIDVRRVPKAVIVNVASFSFRQGFSTLTMQLARNLYQQTIGSEKNISRKIKEIITTLDIEKTYSKREILEMYLNTTYYGQGAYGIQSASRIYFGKDVDSLKIEEGALLIAMLKAPEYYSPIKHQDRALTRRNVVLNNMRNVGFISDTECDSLKAIPVTVTAKEEDVGIGPYFTEYIRQQLNKVQEKYGVNVYQDGLSVYTTLDTRIQSVADSAINKHLPRIQKEVYKKWIEAKIAGQILDPEGKMTEEDLEKIYADTLLADSLLHQKLPVQVALIAINPKNGHILAIVGGRDFEKYKFNRAVQAMRQPGSAFKPFIYTTAVDNGYPVTTELLNQPVVVMMPDGTRWSPDNYDRSVGGLTTFREAIRRSLNLVAARMIQEVVKPQAVVEYAKEMGITTRIAPVDAMALGVSEVYLLDITSAYGIFPNKGVRVEPISILRIEDKAGQIIEENAPLSREVLSEETAYIMTDLLKTNADRGSGAPRFAYGFYRTAGGKTGTTNDFTDAWFIGFTPQIVAGVWVGLDDPKMTLGQGMSGQVVAVPIWATFMKSAHDTLKLPIEDFVKPEGVVKLKICNDTKKLANIVCPSVTEEIFNQKYAPAEYCDKHQKPKPQQVMVPGKKKKKKGY
jgi:penicillin-binding protein 1A